MRIPAQFLLLFIVWLAMAGTSVFANDPPDSVGKDDSPVSPLLQQFILERETTSTQQSPQPDSGAVTRGQSAESRATTKDAPGSDSAPSSNSRDDLVRFDSSGNVQVYINVTDTTDGTLQQLRNLGADIEIVNSDWNKLQAWVSVEALDLIADLDAVRSITPPDYGFTNAGSVNTEGDGIHRTDLVRHLTGLTGEGVRVGVISDGVDSWHSARASGDLPNSLEINPNISRSGDEGTALLEIVHDLASDAELAFSSAGTSLVFVEAVLWLANKAFDGEGADIIVDDLSFNGDPFFEDGPVALAAEDAVAGGAVFVSAAGNDAFRHYEADFVDGGGGYHAFDGDSDISLRVTGARAGAILQWNDPFGTSGNDYDMFMCPPGLKPVKFNLQNRICNSSIRVQDGNDDPVEGVYLNDGEADIYIRKFSGDDRRLELFLEFGFGRILEHGVPEGGIVAQAAAAGVLAAGAIDASDPGNDGAEELSDRGPSRIYDYSDDSFEDRPKPDVMGIDGVLVTGAGGFGTPQTGITGNRFFGTSAAAPHVAGIAALVMEAQRKADPSMTKRKADPSMTKKEVADAVTQTLRDTAIDLGDPGYDGTFGYGRADTLAAVESIADFELYSEEPFTFEFTVNSTGDGADSSTTDVTCDDGSGNCTLRAAIQQANVLSSGVIKFNITGTGTRTISPASTLPTITKPVFIDGYSQPGASDGTLLIELDGASAGTDVDGLTLSGKGSVVRGLVVNGFEGNGIVLQGSDGGQALVGNHIGTSVAGSADDGNGSAGVYVNGAPDVLLRDNVISGNDTYGVHISGSGASGAVLIYNTIGLNTVGTADLGNTKAGVHIDGASDAALLENTISGNDTHGISVSGSGAASAVISGNTIGLNDAGDASVGNTNSGVHISGANDVTVVANSISGNGSHGVALTGSGTYDTLVGPNYIGTNESGASLGNGGSGVHIGDSSLNNTVEENTIANNGGDGVTVVSSGSTGNTIRKNSIHTHTGHGIDLGDDGATANDAGDTDTGPNSLRNYPTDITFAYRDDVASTSLKVNTISGRRYIVDFYGCDSSSSGEGEEWLGFTEFGAGTTGETTWTANTIQGVLEDYSPVTGTHVTATVTELQTNSTSEFAPCVALVDLPKLDLSVDVIEVTEDSTTETTYTMALVSEPSETVRVQIVVQFSSVSNIVNPTTGYPYTLAFTTTDWNDPKSITVFGVTDDDALDESNEIQHRIRIGGVGHITKILPVFVTDDEAPSPVTLTSTTSGVTFPDDVSAGYEYDGILDLDEGDTFTYTVAMDEEPDGDVTVETSYSSGDALTVTPDSITFTKTGEAADADKWEWDDPQTVTLTALHDADDRNEFRSVKHRVAVGSEDYVVAQLSIDIRDLALPGLAFDPADLAVSVNEGGTATYTVALASDPGATATVEISVESGPFDNAISVWPDELSFTGGATGNWSTPQTVTVTGHNDDDEFDDLPELEHILKVGSKVALGPNAHVTVVDGNRAPYFLDGAETTRRVAENAGQNDEVGDPVEALDLNASDTLTYSLEDTSGKFAVNSSTGQITVAADDSLDYETSTEHEFNVIVKDGGGLSDKIDVRVLVRNVDEPLVISGDASPTFNENANINNSVARYTARDPEGSQVTFSWSVEGSDSGDFTIDSSGNLRFISQPDHETQDEYSITVVATDDADPFSRGELAVTVAVTDVNEAPEIIGNSSETYQENQTYPVATFGFIDREGDDVAWSLAGTDRGDFSITETINGSGQLEFASTPDHERPADSGGNNEYRVTVVATDDGTPAQVGRLEVTVTVDNVNEPPSTPIGNTSITVAENSTGNLARYSSTDPDQDDTVRWEVSGADADEFRVDSSGNLAFDGAPDYEMPGDSGGNNVYQVSVDAKDPNDSNLFSSIGVTVTVAPVDEPPVISGASTFDDHRENDSNTIETYTAVDPEGDASITWALGGTDRGDFDISSGALAFKTTPDYERPADSGGNNHYDLTVYATDSNGKRGELHVDIIVKNVDEPPVISGTEAVDGFPENSAASRQVGRYIATDPEGATVTLGLSSGGADFTLASNGVLTFRESPDYEEQDGYTVTVKAEAGIHSGSDAVLKTVNIDIQNLEEPGTVSLSSVQPQVDTVLTATLEDDDVPSTESWQWYRASSRSSPGTAIDGATSATYTPDSGDVGSYLRAVASYDDGFDTGNTAEGVSANRVQEAPPAPEPPVFPQDGDYGRTIRENTRAGINLGAPVRATDGNNDRLTYSIPPSDNIEIDASSGQLHTKVELDHEATPTLNTRVTATDPGGLSATIAVTVTVEDVDETPVVTGPSRPEVAENGGTNVATYSATDPDRKGIAWVLTGSDSDAFALSSGGVLAFNDVPDFEEKNSYRVTIEAHEQGDGTSVARLNATVRVTNVDEPGVVQANAVEPRVGQTLRASVEDKDGGESVSEWKWESGVPNSPCGTVDSPLVSTWETIPGASGNSYTPTADDQGHCIRVTAIYNDRAGSGRSEQFLTTESVEFGPYFDSDTATGRVEENSVEGRNVGRFRARHSNSGETLTYSLTSGDTSYFTVDSDGQLKTSDTTLDYESLPGPEAQVRITATDNNNQTATVTVTVAVTDECRTAGEPPCAPSVTPASATSLRVSWSAPNADSHDIQYREAGSGASWTQELDLGAGRSHTIAGLNTGTEYEVQVRTVIGGTSGDWSPSGMGTPRTPPPPPPPAPAPDPDPPITTTGGGDGSSTGGGSVGGGGGGGFAFAGGGGAGGGAPAQQRPVNNFQSPQQIFQPLVVNETLRRVWRFFALGQRWLFYDPRASFQRFNTLRTVNVASDPPAILLVNFTRRQQFRGYNLFEGWNFVLIESEPPAPRTGRNLQQIDQLLRPLVQNGTLERVWRLNPRTQGWELYDPDPAFASVNTLSTIDLNANPPVVLAVAANQRTEFRSATLYPGWNYVVMR